MAIGNFSLPFTQQTTHKMDIRTRPSKYAQSDIRNWAFEQSDGVRPAEYFSPYRCLPVGFQDTTTEDWVVIPKGRIVAALSTEDSTPVSGIVYPSSSGKIPLGFEPSELGSTLLSGYIDGSYFGYDEHTVGLLVPCNGGTTCTGFYTADDVTAQIIAYSGVYAIAGGPIVMPANIPVGVVYHDWYQDIRGKWLNYKAHPDGGGILTDYYVEVPYVKVSDTGSYSGVNPQYNGSTYANQTTWRNVNKIHTYLTINGNDSEVLRNGCFVASDYIGNYKLQQATTSFTDASGVAVSTGWTSYNQFRTTQTVGKIVAIDNRFPKGGLDDVMTYPRSGMPGSQTAGLPKALFDFVYQCIYIGTGTAPTVEGIYDAVRSGDFGLVRIKLLIA